MTDITVAMVQPIGHASQMPVDANGIDKTLARTTRKARSVKVAVINFVIIPAPRRTPSDTSFSDTTK